MPILHFSELPPDVAAPAAGDWGDQDPLTPLPGHFPDDPDRWLRRHAELALIPDRHSARLVFLGDSLTEGWCHASGSRAWRAHFAARGALNLGVAGDRTQQVLWRLSHGALDGLDPDGVVLLLGVNNLWTGRQDNRRVAKALQAVATEIARLLPRTRILHLGLLPAGERPEGTLRQHLQAVNAALAAAPRPPRTRFRDLGSAFVEPDGRINPAVMPDFCHLSESGYTRLAHSLVPEIEALLS
jgi:beta-glucosidase